jgi:hypothetical protein
VARVARHDPWLAMTRGSPVARPWLARGSPVARPWLARGSRGSRGLTRGSRGSGPRTDPWLRGSDPWLPWLPHVASAVNSAWAKDCVSD